MPLFVGPDQTDDNHVPFLTLETVDRVHRHGCTERAQVGVLPNQAAQILHLRPVRGNDAEVDAFVEHPVRPDTPHIVLDSLQREFGLLFVDTAKAFADKLFVTVVIEVACVNPGRRRVQIENTPVAHVGGGFHAVGVEPMRGKGHQRLVHPVLHIEQGDGFGPVADNPFHQGERQSAPCGRQTFHRRRELLMVACQHDPVGTAHGYPARGFECLGCLVYKQGVEMHVAEQRTGRAGQRACDGTCLLEQPVADAPFQFRDFLPQGVDFRMERGGSLRPGHGEQLAKLPPRCPELWIVGVGCETPFVAMIQHLVGDAQRVAYPQHRNAAFDELLGNPVDRHVALGTDQHLALAPEHLVDGLDQRCRFPRPGRAVDDSHVAGTQHLADGMFLGVVQPRERHRLFGSPVGRTGGMDGVAEFRQASAACGNHVVECAEHQAVCRFVETQLHAQPFNPADGRQGFLVGQFRDYPERFGIADNRLHGQVRQSARHILRKETKRPAGLEVMFDVRIRRAADFDDEPSCRVVVAAPHGSREEAVAPLDFPAYSLYLRFAAESLLLVLVFLLEQFALSRQADSLTIIHKSHIRSRMTVKVGRATGLAAPLYAESHRKCIVELHVQHTP